MDLILSLVPWWVWAVVGIALVAFAYFRLGPKVALAALVAIGVFLLDRRAFNRGVQSKARQQEDDDRQFVLKFEEVNREARSRDTDELDARNSRWLRKP